MLVVCFVILSCKSLTSSQSKVSYKTISTHDTTFIRLHDSVYQNTEYRTIYRNDTIYVYHDTYKYVYRDAANYKHDVNKVVDKDTVNISQPIKTKKEKEKKWWNKLLLLCVAYLVGWLLYVKLYKRGK